MRVDGLMRVDINLFNFNNNSASSPRTHPPNFTSKPASSSTRFPARKSTLVPFCTVPAEESTKSASCDPLGIGTAFTVRLFGQKMKML